MLLTRDLCQSIPGTLYPYAEPTSSSDTTTTNGRRVQEDDDQEKAWNVAYDTVQQAEYVIRGHAARIPGTMWNRWWLVDEEDDNDYFEAPSSSQPPQHDNSKVVAQESLQHIIAIIDRLQQEGNMYMELRHERKMQLARERGEDVEMQIGQVIGEEDHNSHEEEQLDNKAHMTELELQKHEAALRRRHPFAAPGPTVAMLDTLLDCFAMAAPECPHLVTPEATAEVLTMILDRHIIDGGDEKNTNPYTVPTLVSYNALFRTMANLPYDAAASTNSNDDDNTSNSNSSNTKKLRDQALYYAFGMYDTLRHANNLTRNSATMTYMLQVVSKFFPPSRTRGNVAHGLWMHAVRQGIVDPHVMEALRAAHTPSNGVEFDDWTRLYLDHKQVRDLPQKLNKYAKVRRYTPREATY